MHITITGFQRKRRVYARDSWFSTGREERVLFEGERDGKGFPSRSSENSLGGKVKQERVVVVEFVQCSALSRRDETKPEGECVCVRERKRERERERERERGKEGGRGRERERERKRERGTGRGGGREKDRNTT